MANVVSCSRCGTRNRLGSPPSGQIPRCGRCQTPLPWLIKADEKSFDHEVMSSRPVLVDFWAGWCSPCRRLAPILEKIAREQAGRLKIVKVDVEQNQRLARRFRVGGLPTLVIFQQGQVVDSLTGLPTKAELTERLAPHLAA